MLRTDNCPSKVHDSSNATQACLSSPVSYVLNEYTKLTPPCGEHRMDLHGARESRLRLHGENPMAETVVLTKEEVMEALRDVYDPEIPVNVVDLGLVYDCKVDDGDVQVKMTLTFAGCGMGPYIAQQAEWRIAELEEVEDVEVEMVYDPPWTPDMISEEGKATLGLD